MKPTSSKFVQLPKFYTNKYGGSSHDDGLICSATAYEGSQTLCMLEVNVGTIPCGSGASTTQPMYLDIICDTVQANVGHEVMPLTLSSGYFLFKCLLLLTYDGLMMSQSHPQHTTNCHKHSDHSGKATHPSSDIR